TLIKLKKLPFLRGFILVIPLVFIDFGMDPPDFQPGESLNRATSFQTKSSNLSIGAFQVIPLGLEPRTLPINRDALPTELRNQAFDIFPGFLLLYFLLPFLG